MRDTQNVADITTTIGGVHFKNPFYVASGPTTKSVRQLQRIEETGWAAASIKLTIDPAPYINREPRYGLFKERKALAFTAEKRLTFEQGLKLVSDAKKVLHDLVLMANMTYAGDDEINGWVNMARRFEEAGADIIELNMCCPNMSYNLETTSGGSQTAAKQTGASMGQHGDIASRIVDAIKSSINIPLFVKLTPEGGNIAKVAKMLYAAGADAVGSTANRLGIPVIDLENPAAAFHALQKEISMACYCGSWLKPLAQRDTYEIRKVCGDDKKIMAAGGITNWRDAVEMVLCGGDLLGVCAETLISGFDIARPMIEGLTRYMIEHDFQSLDAMRNIIVPQVRTATDLTLYDGYAKIMKPNMSAPCKSACPHHVPAQAYIQKVAKREYKDAYDLITGTHAMQEICALACEHPCEDACIRGSVDAPIKIREIKRFVLEYGKAKCWNQAWNKEGLNGHKVAVVGSGIAGLSFASQMAQAGYEVAIFDENEEPGGSLRTITPSFRLDKAVLNEEIEHLKMHGVSFRQQQKLGSDVTLDGLLAEGYEAIFLALGAGESNAPEGTLTSRAYLREAGIGKAPNASTVLVAGEDIDAVDAARTAIRDGASTVYLLLPKVTPSLTFLAEQLAYAKEEGVQLIEHARVLAVDGSEVSVNISGVETKIHSDLIITSLNGVLPESLFQAVSSDKGRIKVDQKTFETNVPGVYAGGEAVFARNTIHAIATARQAAASADRKIRGENATVEPIGDVETVSRELVLERHGYIKKDRNYVDLTIEKPLERVKNEALVTRVMSEEEAVREAERCLNCGCGEGCQLCKTICSVFAPDISAPDTLYIDEEACVACGMCALRCPIHNIEMINLGHEI